ncbi:MAG: hypothetical protein HC842_00875 [Cytophagales bacterium]|nr:hypothetical protein [Cytophagales bacterium]
MISQKSRAYGLGHTFAYSEVFPSTGTHPECYALLYHVAQQLDSHPLDRPFAWSEDFGHYAKAAKTGFFGIGAGLETAPLHHPDYDFPDELLEKGLAIYDLLIKTVLNT